MQHEVNERHIHRGAPATGSRGHTAPVTERNTVAHNYDNEARWTIETYDRHSAATLKSIGATEVKSAHDGRVYDVDARQLVQYIAESNGLIVEFRKRRRQQLSPEERERRRQRMQAVRQAQNA